MDRVAEFPIRHDITIRQGSMYERLIRLEYLDNDDLDMMGNPTLKLLDTDGYTALMQARLEPSSSSTVLSVHTTNARIITGIQSDSSGSWNLHIRIPATDTAQLPGGFIGVYDLELQPPGDPGGRFALFHGTFCVEPEVSR